MSVTSGLTHLEKNEPIKVDYCIWCPVIFFHAYQTSWHKTDIHARPTMFWITHSICVITINVNVKDNFLNHLPSLTHKQWCAHWQACTTLWHKARYGVCMLSRPSRQHAAIPPRPSLPHNDWLWCDWWFVGPSLCPDWCQREKVDASYAKILPVPFIALQWTLGNECNLIMSPINPCWALAF